MLESVVGFVVLVGLGFWCLRRQKKVQNEPYSLSRKERRRRTKFGY
jgi:hypothetical protein